jgi:hypothetical protein
LAAVGKRLVASMFYDNELLVLDPDSLKILKRIPLDARSWRGDWRQAAENTTPAPPDFH